jgi:co-chaperonin GroES (HSP10)
MSENGQIQGEEILGGRIDILPIGTRIIVKRIEETMTRGGLLLPEKSKEQALIGEVIRCGDQCDFVHEGDMVMFGQFSGKEFANSLTTDTYQGWKGCIIMVEDDVLAHVARGDYERAKAEQRARDAELGFG